MRTSRWGALSVLALTTLVVLAGVWLVDRPWKQSSSSAEVQSVQPTVAATGPAPEVGKPAPDVTATDVAGAPVSLRALRGRPVWLTFGASWCSSCRAEAPDIQEAYTREKTKGLAVVAIYMSEDASRVKDFAQRLHLTYTQVPDPETAITSAYRVMGVPAHVFIDRSGTIRSIHMGILDADRVKSALALIQ